MTDPPVQAKVTRIINDTDLAINKGIADSVDTKLVFGSVYLR